MYSVELLSTQQYDYMKKTSYIFLLTFIIISSCKGKQDYSVLEDSVESMLSAWVANDTAIDAVAKGVKNLHINGPVEADHLISSTNKVYSTEFDIIDTYKDSILGKIYAKVEINNLGLIQTSENKIAVKVDSIIKNGQKVNPNLSELNSVVFLNEKTRNSPKIEKANNTYTPSISLNEYVENLRNDGMTMFHIDGDNVLIFTRWDDPVGGNADSQAEALYRQAKAAHVNNIRSVRIMKMPEKKVVGRYVSRKK